MKIAVCIKQTPDTETVPTLNADGTDVELDDITWIINPHDESAIEVALQLAEKHNGTVSLVALGPGRVEKALREGLAMGADEAIHLSCPEMPHDAHVVAQCLAPVLKQHGFDLVLTGQVSVDSAGGQLPQRLSVLLDWPGVTAVENLDLQDQEFTASRPVKGGQEIYTGLLPAVLGINRRIGEPRYPSFRGIMKAKRKPIRVVEIEVTDSRLTIEQLYMPSAKSAGQVIAHTPGAAAQVAGLLRDEAKVI